MSDLKAKFLAEIIADPDNDEPRLVYADYLLSQPEINDQRRGKIMAVQCSAGWRDPEQHLSLERKLRSTVKYLPELIREDIPTTLSRSKLLRCRFERGFLYDMVLDLREWEKERPHLIPLLPRLGGLRLSGVNALREEDIEFFRGLSIFQFSELYYSNAILQRLMANSSDARWEELHLSCAALHGLPSVSSLPCLRRLFLYSRATTSLPSLDWLDRLERLDLHNFILDAALLRRLPPCLSLVSLTGCSLHEDAREVLGESSFVALYQWLADRPAIKSLSWHRLDGDYRPVLEHPRIISNEVYFYGYPSLSP